MLAFNTANSTYVLSDATDDGTATLTCVRGTFAGETARVQPMGFYVGDRFEAYRDGRLFIRTTPVLSIVGAS